VAYVGEARKLLLSLNLSRLVTLAACAASFLCVPAAAGAVTYPAGFEEQQVVGGLTRPTNVAWAPDGRTFIVEKDGLLKVVAPGARRRVSSLT
jgi:hypothetical protein